MERYADSLGGYGELELPLLDHKLHENALAVQSARAALYLFLESVNAEIIYLPDYLCDSVLPAINSLKVKIERYHLDEQLNPKFLGTLGPKQYLLLVNYFGLYQKQIALFLDNAKISLKNVIIDNSQALFESPITGATTIYSPRKFLGLPDGGFLYTNEDVVLPREQFNASYVCTHLLLRSANETEEGYEHFLSAEKSLEDFQPLEMSIISKRLIKSYDFKILKRIRRENFNLLNEEFNQINELKFDADKTAVPLCFPLKLKIDVTKICLKLCESKIFLPRYWPNCANDDFYNLTLFLPVDHKLDAFRMQKLISKVKELTNHG